MPYAGHVALLGGSLLIPGCALLPFESNSSISRAELRDRLGTPREPCVIEEEAFRRDEYPFRSRLDYSAPSEPSLLELGYWFGKEVLEWAFREDELPRVVVTEGERVEKDFRRRLRHRLAPHGWKFNFDISDDGVGVNWTYDH